jgi:hypothetical protein
VGEELQGHDVVADAAAGHKGNLLWVDDGGEAGPKAAGQHKRIEAIVGAGQGDGAVAGGVSAVASLEEEGDEPLME